MSVLAQAPPAELAAVLDDVVDRPAYRLLRRPETGLVMVRGRAGGTGMQFNLGELPVTRCSVELDDGTVGHAYVGGRNHAHAEMAAWLDALLQDERLRPRLERALIEPLAARQDARRRTRAERAAETKVEFFTMVRGEE
jgi:alpha-D-ribose 1-methylphosphonate 5-triphosphate synthase subunit PhnG